ncbi:glycosyltransferase family 2 protein [Ideonella sp.]|uniref:glycosyltransferase family 2 protein n=1 Tax=Ideonella sp. TaxID=1929293 RepID=UPI0035AE5029
MHACALPAIDADLPGLLKHLQRHFAAGDDAGLAATLADTDPERITRATTLVGALCIGGAAFALKLVSSQYPALGDDECTGAVLEAFSQVVDPPQDAAPDHEQQIAQWLVDSFELQAPASSLLDIVRADFLIDRAPLQELPQAVNVAMQHEQWELALRGLTRVKTGLQAGTPRRIYGLASLCLHRLGRYEQANQWVRDGLSDEQKQLLHIPAVQTEDALLRRWGADAKPVVSIVCTTYNHERYIDSTIRGFLSQDCPFPFEILIHDDASTDRTQDVIRQWQQRYPKLIKPVLQTVNQKSQGVRPFELLLAKACGDFVATCEGDDFWVDPAKLRRQVGYLIEHPDVSCSAHNYYHFVESTLVVKPWRRAGPDFFISPRQLMGLQFLLWLPTLVFRKTFSALPPERALAAFGDQFLTSYLGTMGRCIYFNTMLGAVRRENEFSTWSPLPEREKERRRVKTWVAMLRMHERLGQQQAVDDLMAKIKASSLDARLKTSLLDDSTPSQSSTLVAA